MLETLDHIVIAVRDLPTARATYRGLLGREPSWNGRHPAYGTSNTLFGLDNGYLELLSPTGEGPVATVLMQHLETYGEGPFALAFGTPDARGCAATLHARGLETVGPLEGHGQDEHSNERRWRNVLRPEAATHGVQLFCIEHHSASESLPRAKPTERLETVVSGFDHVVVQTPDAERALTLYGEKLGLRLALDRTFEARSVRLLFFRVGGVTVEIAAPLTPAEPDAKDRFWGIAYRVPDLPEGQQRLARAGFDVSDVRPGHKSGTQVCTVQKETHGVATLLIGPA